MPDSLGGYSQCRQVAEATAQKYGLPIDLVYAVIQIESSCRVDPGNSGAGAVGIAQIKPSTFSQYGCSGSVYNPQDAINCAGKILSSLYSQFGSYALAAAGYQAGSGNVAKSAPCVPGTADKNESTLAYVKSVLAKAGLPFDAPADCSGSNPTGNNMNGQYANPYGVEPNQIGIDPQVRRYIILGIAFVLFLIAFTRLGATKK